MVRKYCQLLLTFFVYGIFLSFVEMIRHEFMGICRNCFCYFFSSSVSTKGLRTENTCQYVSHAKAQQFLKFDSLNTAKATSIYVELSTVLQITT